MLTELAAAPATWSSARYAAIGIPEPEGDEFARFVTVGMSDELVARLGPLPAPTGCSTPCSPTRRPTGPPTSPPIPASAAGGRPPTRSCGRSSGVPIVSAGDIIGAFYLTDKQRAPAFTAGDEAAVVLLASHAAIAIDQARLFEDSRELALTQERAASPASCTTP